MIKLSTGVKKIQIERDEVPVGEISFNPANTHFKERVFSFVNEIEKKQKEWDKRAVEIDGVKKEEDRLKALMKFEREFFGYFALVYTDLFGEGADKIIQGESPLDKETTISLFDSVINGWVVPELNKFTKSKEAKYSGKK